MAGMVGAEEMVEAGLIVDATQCRPRARLNRSLPVDLDIFFAAAMRDGNHDANADQDRDSDQSPRGANVLQNTQFPERRQKTTHQDDKTN
jgi:hypothetical protein